jgi:hypothetical protein
MQPQLMIQGVNIVLRGNFNPTIFHPSWLASQELIRSQEADAAEIKIIHPQVAQFEMEWLQMNVTIDRFQAGTTQESYHELLRDLVIGIFSLLPHTPLRALGINRNFHYRLESKSAQNAVGYRLVPKQNWQEVLSGPGMLTLTVQGQRPDNLNGYIQVKVEPSAKEEFGIFLEVNDHYTLSASEIPESASEAITVIAEQWNQSMQRGLKIAEKIVYLGECE